MLPKVATQILHSTSRAVSSIKPIRNVLHQSPCPGSSHRGNSGGSARFTGPARAVTQANPVLPAHDGVFDDQDDQPPRRAPVSARIRSNSIPARPSVLKVVQLHARARHAFATDTQEESQKQEPRSQEPQSQEPQSPQSQSQEPQSQSPPPPQKTVSHAAKRLLNARLSGNSAHAAEVVREFRQSVVNPSVREFNAALQALQATRRPGEPLDLMLETYNDMLRHSLLPNAVTYVTLIDCLTARDHEVHSAITALERRIKHRTLIGYSQPAAHQADRKRIDVLRSENNFNTAMSLFETLLSIGGNKSLHGYTYTSLIRSCAIHSNIDAAIHIWAQFENRDDFFPNPNMFLEMIRVYTNAGQFAGADEIFSEYRAALQSGKLHLSWDRDTSNPNRLNLLVWNQMIETHFRNDRPDKAVALVDQMLQANTDNLQHNVVVDPPPVSSATFTTVITGFCHIGDVQTALVWFERLLAQSPSSFKDPFQPAGVVTKPDDVAWDVILDALAVKHMIEDLNRLYNIRARDDPTLIRDGQRAIVYSANMACLQSMDDDKYSHTLEWLVADVINTTDFGLKHRLNLVAEISTAYLERKMYEKAVRLVTAYMGEFTRSVSGPYKHRAPPLSNVQEMQLKFTDKLYEISQGDFPYSISMELARCAVELRISQPPSFVPFFLQSYALSRASKNLPVSSMTRRDWELLLMAASSFESLSKSEDHPQIAVPNFAYQGLESVIHDLAAFTIDFENMDKDLVRTVIDQLCQRLGPGGMVSLIKQTGFMDALHNMDQYLLTIENPVKDSASETSGADSGYASDVPPKPLKMDHLLSRIINEQIKGAVPETYAVTVNDMFAQFKKAVESGRSPNPTALALLLEWLGRFGRMEDLKFTYGVAQNVLQTLENDKVAQTKGWFDVENAMIGAYAHQGDVESAHQHRKRIFANGGVPNAEAYGALILSVKDTTDDASNALELFHESQTYRVVPTQYLYNNIISKLSKARKAEYALELFKQMKEMHLTPSSVTYGIVISACARVGDVHSAEALFSEMTQIPNFRRRIPPYNTMMQLYTTTKPDRERVLYFYQELIKAKIAPTAHTYKLLLDAYGSIEPVDLEKMESTFQKLQNDRRVVVQSTHYAALINAYGCAAKNLDKALEVFHTMDISHDALVYEALFSVFTVHREEDLINQYLTKMHLEGVHMTAYIANSLIKCYSILDKIEEARKLFESLEDPPEGVAAPNNHAPHSPSRAVPVDPSAPVYREPSTWEAMVRAELGSGNRDGAIALLERLKARQYPEAVYNRISGILVDHSQVPP